MAPAIVERLQRIQIDKQDRQGAIAGAGTVDAGRQHSLKVLAVVKAGHRIDHCQAPGGAHFGGAGRRNLAAADQNRQPRPHFVDVDRQAGNIGHAKIECLDQCCRVVARHQAENDRRLALSRGVQLGHHCQTLTPAVAIECDNHQDQIAGSDAFFGFGDRLQDQIAARRQQRPQ